MGALTPPFSFNDRVEDARGTGDLYGDPVPTGDSESPFCANALAYRTTSRTRAAAPQPSA
jgi:hypothetical protein